MKDSIENAVGVAWMLLFWPLIIGLISWAVFQSFVALIIVFILLLIAELIISGITMINFYN